MATIQVRRGTKAQLDSITLASGELGFTTDTKQVFVGDGSNNLPIGGGVSTGTSFPSSPNDGDLFWHETQEILYLWSDTASAWIDLTSGGVNDKSLFRNAIINGDMRIAQRGTSFAAVANGDYTIDRWRYYKLGTMVHTITQDSTAPAQFGYSIKLDCTTADASIATGDYCMIRQLVEGYNFRKFVGQTATLSFWVRAGQTGTMCVAFTNSGADRSYVSEVTINAANTWEKKSVTLDFDYSGGTWDYTNGIGIKIDFMLACGSTFHTTPDAWQTGLYLATSNQTNFCDNTANNVWITGVQLELGSVATDFEFLDIETELAHCQRYYEIGKSSQFLWIPSGSPTSGSVVSRNMYPYKVTKRAQAVPTLSNQSGSNSLDSTLNAYTTEYFAINLVTDGVGSGHSRSCDWEADAEL